METAFGERQCGKGAGEREAEEEESVKAVVYKISRSGERKF